jgi:hypothetical protein
MPVPDELVALEKFDRENDGVRISRKDFAARFELGKFVVDVFAVIDAEELNVIPCQSIPAEPNKGRSSEPQKGTRIGE